VDVAHRVSGDAARAALEPERAIEGGVFPAGSIDVYQDQMVAHKRDAMEAGLDWATPELEDEAFLHMDASMPLSTISRRFTAAGRDQRQLLKEAA
jgi:hypothetical protein